MKKAILLYLNLNHTRHKMQNNCLFLSERIYVKQSDLKQQQNTRARAIKLNCL